MGLPLRGRSALAQKLLGFKQSAAAAVVEEFFHRHPDWSGRYGEGGRQHGLADACYHIDFLAAAIEAGETQPFVQYVRWTVGMLNARQIEARFIAEYLDQIGTALSRQLSNEDARVVKEFIDAGVGACEAGSTDAAAEPQTDRLALARSVFLQAVLNGKRSAALTAASEALRNGHSLLDVYADVLQEAMYETGRRWAANEIPVAQEHMATAITQYVMAHLYTQLEPRDTDRGKIVITGVEGELHQVGANMVADILEAEGWDVRFLGTNMPHAGILEVTEEYQPDILGISATMLFSLPRVVSLIHDFRKTSSERNVRIILGGAAFRSTPSLVAELGVDGFAPDIRASVELVARLQA